MHDEVVANVRLLESGRRTVWATATSPIFEELRSLLIKTVGPRAVLEDRFRGVRGVERAFIYGAWASRYHGEPGPQPQDIDVIGSANVTDVRTEADIATGTLSRDVNVAVLTPAECRTRSQPTRPPTASSVASFISWDAKRWTDGGKIHGVAPVLVHVTRKLPVAVTAIAIDSPARRAALRAPTRAISTITAGWRIKRLGCSCARRR